MGDGVYAIAGGKGGVGKTTTAINLGVVLGQAGYEVVVVDADLAMPDVGRQLHLGREGGLHSVLAEETAVREVVVDGPGGLAVIPGDRDLASFAEADPARLRKVFNLLGIAYDVVLVDTAPGLQNEAVITYQEVDGVVLVTTPEPNAVEDMEKTGQLAADVGADLLGAVVTHGEGRRAREAASELDGDLLGVVPHHSTGGPITAAAPGDAAADAYRRIAAALPAVDAEAVVPDGVPDVARTEPGADGTVSADSDTDDTDAEPTAAGASESDGPDADTDGPAGTADDSDGTEPVVDGDRAGSADAEPDERVEDADGADAVASGTDDDTEGADPDTAETRLTAEIPKATAVAGDGPDETDGSPTDEGDDVLELVDDAVEKAQDVDVDHVDEEIESAAETADADDRGTAADLDDEPDGFDLGSNGSGS
ncbi:P-loop NTPase [Halorientalis pallida]|uniref:P-loop NTPase n=1 Tax=Halorientalis pallida TaxID=2479928 RepID=UPI003C6F2D4B